MTAIDMIVENGHVVTNDTMFDANLMIDDGKIVGLDKLVSELPEVKSKFLGFDFYAPGPKAIFPYQIKEVTTSGVIGDATKASLVKGEQILELAVKYLVDFVRDIETSKLPGT